MSFSWLKQFIIIHYVKIHQLNTIKITRKTTKMARERYQSLSEEEKENKQHYGSERYKNLPEDEKQNLVEYRKKYYRMKKTPHYN